VRLAFLILSAWALCACGLPSEGDAARGVPTHEVTRGPFQHAVTAEGNLEAVESTTVSVPKSSVRSYTIAWVAEDASRVREGDVVVRFERDALEKSLADGEADLEAADHKLKKEELQTKTALRNLDRDAVLADARLSAARDFQPRDEDLFSRNDIIQGEIDAGLAETRTVHAKSQRRRKEAEAVRDRELLNIERRKAEFAIERASDGLSAIEVTAPHDGILLLKRNRQGQAIRAGESVWQGQELAKIPDLGRMEAEVHVLEADAGGLAVGKAATVWVEAHPERGFAGTVARVDDLARPRVQGSPVQYFGVTLELETTDPERMKPGQRVRAELEQLDLHEVIAIPRQAVFDEDGDSVAWVARGDGFEPSVLVLGEGTPGRVIVESGLEPGDRIALRDPSRRAQD
jgi:hypothetical protein